MKIKKSKYLVCEIISYKRQGIGMVHHFTVNVVVLKYTIYFLFNWKNTVLQNESE